MRNFMGETEALRNPVPPRSLSKENFFPRKWAATTGTGNFARPFTTYPSLVSPYLPTISDFRFSTPFTEGNAKYQVETTPISRPLRVAGGG